jgi:hypothetical protein
MDKNPIDNIYKLIREGKVIGHKNRQEFLCEMIQGVIKSRPVIFSEIADKIDKPIKQSSIERRIQDFFAKVSFDYQQLATFLMSFVPHDQLTLSIDRTEWDFGQTITFIWSRIVAIGIDQDASQIFQVCRSYIGLSPSRPGRAALKPDAGSSRRMISAFTKKNSLSLTNGPPNRNPCW